MHAGYSAHDDPCVITCTAIVSEDAKAGDTLTNTVTIEAITDIEDPDSIVSVSDTAVITVAGDEDEEEDGDEDIDDGDDIDADDGDADMNNDMNKAPDKDTAADEDENLDHSPECGDDSLDVLKIFCPILWII